MHVQSGQPMKDESINTEKEGVAGMYALQGQNGPLQRRNCRRGLCRAWLAVRAADSNVLQTILEFFAEESAFEVQIRA